MERPVALSSSIELQLDVEPDIRDIWADHDRLLQAFENLIGNAIKFTSPGGRITVGAASTGNEVLFRVADTGCGISPGEDARWLDPIERMIANIRAGTSSDVNVGVVLRRSFAILPRLIDKRGSKQLRGVKLGDRESVNPGFTTTRETVQPSAIDVEDGGTRAGSPAP